MSIDFEESETVFVGPNNCGKTSATDIFRLFLRSGDFSIYDFSASQVSKFDEYGHGRIEGEKLPGIELDLWFSIDPETEFGRAGLLLPDTEQDYQKVGIRLRYTIDDPEKLKESYLARLNTTDGKPPRKPLTHYLSLPGTIKQHFAISYFALNGSAEDANEKPLPSDDGKRLLKSLLRVEFVDAQRRIDDHEQTGSTRLSKVFTGYYKRNLTQAETADETNSIIDKHNDDLTSHYHKVFANLLKVIESLGVPSVNDRSLRVISALVPETVLQNNATLSYVDPAHAHELPEKYNGLGVKNLIYLAIQICEFQISWMTTEQERPLALLLFIEEPEVHLHAQAQQTFIQNAWRIIREASHECGEDKKTPQLVVTTHSSHILDTVDFAKVRYFRRTHSLGEASVVTTTLNASSVLNLRRFNPLCDSSTESAGDSGDTANESDSTDPKEAARATLDFLKKYLTLTHCDLFFADAAVLVEGTVEKLLLPKMIELEASGLRQRYLTVLEVGGAYSHRFASLLEFISIPYVVITDIDSVDPKQNRSSCRPDTPGAVSANAAIKFFLKASSIADLRALDSSARHLNERRCYVAYQCPTEVDGYEKTSTMHGRTFEEAFAYENIKLFRNGTLRLSKKWTAPRSFEDEYKAVYDSVNSSTFKKTEFALLVASSDTEWVTPTYISDGLKWLEGELRATVLGTQQEANIQ